MRRVIAIKPENCTGCRMCELACSSAKEGLFSPERSRIRVVSDALAGWSRPAVCLQCEDPMCMAVCPVQAISRAETEAGDSFIQVDREKCIGCQRCCAACPFGAVAFHAGSRAVKCDLCGGSPKCVEFCFYGCLSFPELSNEEYEKRGKRVKALTNRACRELSKRERAGRRSAFSADAAGVFGPVKGNLE